MFHLAHKLYLCHDSLVDVDKNRVVISKENGFKMHEVIQKLSSGTLVMSGKTIEEAIGTQELIDFFDELLKFAIKTDKPLYIYADKKNMAMLQSAWYKIIFAEPNRNQCERLYNANVFKYNMFFKGRFSSNTGNPHVNLLIDPKNFAAEYDKTKEPAPHKRRSFIIRYARYLNVEILLANYIYDGSMKDELKNVITKLLRKDIEKYIYELKEIFLVHFASKNFRKWLGLSKNYTIDNIDEIVNDKSKYAELFMSNRIFVNSGMGTASSGNKNLRLEAITAEDIEAIKEFTILSGTTWGEEAVYQFIKSDINKLDFLDILVGNFPDYRLDELIEAECTFEHAAGSFFSIDLETVNNYLIEYILEAKIENKKENLRHFRITS